MVYGNLPLKCYAGRFIFVYPYIITNSVADPECARGGGVSHILAEKRGVSFTLFQKMHENAIFSPRTEGEGGAYAGYALCWIRH